MDNAKTITVPAEHQPFIVLWVTGFFLSSAESWLHFEAGVIGAVLMAAVFLSRWLYAKNFSRPSLLIDIGIYATIILNLAYRWPAIANHHVLMMIGSVAAILPLIRTATNRTSWSFYPQVLLALIFVYFLAGFHKINVDYLASEMSCSKMILDNWWFGFRSLFENRLWNISEIYFSASTNSWYPILTIVFEIECAVLLFLRGTRMLGILAALLLHLILGPVGFVDFATIAAACLVPTVITDRDSGYKSVLIYAGAQFFLGLANIWLNKTQWADYAYSAQGFAFVLLAIFITYKVIRRAIAANSFRIEGTWPRYPVAAAAVALFGLSNYLGLGTANSFSMFSNIRTEGPSANHLLMPKSLQIFDYQKDIYFIVAIGTEGVLGANGKLNLGAGLNRVELERLFDVWDNNKWPSYFRVAKGSPASLEIIDVLKDKEFADRKISYLEKKLLYFRVVQDFDEVNICRW